MAREGVNSKVVIINEPQWKCIHTAGVFEGILKKPVKPILNVITNKQFIYFNGKRTFIEVIVSNEHHYKCIHMPLLWWKHTWLSWQWCQQPQGRTYRESQRSKFCLHPKAHLIDYKEKTTFIKHHQNKQQPFLQHSQLYYKLQK